MKINHWIIRDILQLIQNEIPDNVDDLTVSDLRIPSIESDKKKYYYFKMMNEAGYLFTANDFPYQKVDFVYGLTLKGHTRLDTLNELEEKGLIAPDGSMNYNKE